MQATMCTDPVQKNELMAKLIRKQPDGVDVCRNNMKALISAARELAGGSTGPLPCKRVLLCGFSLGAITSLDVALQQGGDETGASHRVTIVTILLCVSCDRARCERCPNQSPRSLVPRCTAVGGVVFMNGAPICVDQWAERLKLHKGLRAHLSAGQADMTLPCEATAWVKQLLDANGASPLHAATELMHTPVVAASTGLRTPLHRTTRTRTRTPGAPLCPRPRCLTQLTRHAFLPSAAT